MDAKSKDGLKSNETESEGDDNESYIDDNEDMYYNDGEDDFLEDDPMAESKHFVNGNAIVELFEYENINFEQAKAFLDGIVRRVSDQLKISPSISKLLLISCQWNESKLAEEFSKDKDGFLDLKRIKPISKQLVRTPPADADSINSLEELSYNRYLNTSSNAKETSIVNLSHKVACNVCLQSFYLSHHKALCCEHYFCKECWQSYLTYSIESGHYTDIECMSSECQILVPEDFVRSILLCNFNLLRKFDKMVLQKCIEAHPTMRRCVKLECEAVIKANETKPKRVICSKCNAEYCFQCGDNYHAPTECKVIQMWKAKCEDDSETANYISANTKDCPNCSSCIEKNGGCNHMKCSSCKHEFCWMCLGSWKTHGVQYYECSKFKENSADTSNPEKARNALRKYLFYYDRWDNHMRSLKLEDKTMLKIKDRINEKVMSSNGTWIDWQYLLDAGHLLARCRYTLQYTYPKAYFMPVGPEKSLFEYQQAQLEAEIENLSWKIENAESTDRGDLENQMNIVQKRKKAILEDFFLSF